MSRIMSALFLFLVAAAAQAEPRPYTIQDQVLLQRISDPQLSPDQSQVAYQVRETDLAANKGVNGIWVVPTNGDPAFHRLTAAGQNSWQPRWSPDGHSLYFLSSRSGSAQLWRLDEDGEAKAVTQLPLDVLSYRLAPDGQHVALALAVYPDCADLACTRARLDERAGRKASGTLYEKLFVRHWDRWADGTRNQLFIAAFDAQGAVSAEPKLLTRGIDGDVPSKPFGDDGEFSFAPDGKALYFSARIAGRSEPWSTNFDIYRVAADASAAPENLTAANPAWDTAPVVSPDGRWLAYRAMKRAGFESDRFGIYLRDLASGATHEVAPNWDRSALTLAWSPTGKSLFTTADDIGQRRLFSIAVDSGRVTPLTDAGVVSAFSVGADKLVYARDSLTAPADLYLHSLQGSIPLTRQNGAALQGIRFGDTQQFRFKGAGGDWVYGYVVTPWNIEKGKKYPVAFIVHGGPEGSMENTFHYRWNAQTYAGRGYAVVFIDFHGSTGYGQAFTDAIAGDWGGKPLEDLKKGWAYALKNYDFLDGDRACALGASYGGFMMNWIEGHWPGAFKCLVNHDGLFDARAMYYSTEELWFPEWESGGTAYAHPEPYEKFNPARDVAQWKTPMLVVHGAQDFRIPLEQGLATFTALQRQGVPSQFLTFPDENHWVLKPQNSIQWHQTVEAWLDRWLKPAP